MDCLLSVNFFLLLLIFLFNEVVELSVVLRLILSLDFNSFNEEPIEAIYIYIYVIFFFKKSNIEKKKNNN